MLSLPPIIPTRPRRNALRARSVRRSCRTHSCGVERRSATVTSATPRRSQYSTRSGSAGHRAVVAHDLADHAGRVEAGEPREIDGGLGLAGALQHAARPRPERLDVARLDEVVAVLGRVDRYVDRARAVVRRDAGRDALTRLDRVHEGRAERCLVVLGHRAEAELVAALLGEAEADEAAGACVAMKLDCLGAPRGPGPRSPGHPRSHGRARRRRPRTSPGGCPRLLPRSSRTGQTRAGSSSSSCP